jgi:translation initiation factor 1 (eIF-1/SUI1)
MNPFLTDTKSELNSNNTNNNSNNDTVDLFSNNDNVDPFSNNDNVDPFSNNDTETIDLLKENQDVELWVSERGRKFDTYISYLPYTKSELDLHLKNLKKKLGCGGSIQSSKDFEPDELIPEYFRIHIQGKQKDYIKEYFLKLGIKNIRVKG